MRVSIQWCNDTNSSLFGYILRHNGIIIARCDDDDELRETRKELEAKGYQFK